MAKSVIKERRLLRDSSAPSSITCVCTDCGKMIGYEECYFVTELCLYRCAICGWNFPENYCIEALNEFSLGFVDSRAEFEAKLERYKLKITNEIQRELGAARDHKFNKL